MPCYKPRPVTRNGIKSNGKYNISFDITKGGDIIMIPCGQCIGCRLERSRQWAIRCVNEAKQYENNCFITLTYRDMQENNSLNKRDFVLFMKKLRKKYGSGIRFFHCGEYGESLERPHHHACIFNHDFADKQYYKQSAGGEKLYISDDLNSLWGHGYAIVGTVTWESAAYVARYVVKKITGETAAGHYGLREPEYVTMSRRPGIGKNWLDEFFSDVYPYDEVVMREGKRFKPPKYYDKILEQQNPEALQTIKQKRFEAIEKKPIESYSRLKTKMTIKKLQLNQLMRGYEKNDTENL